jgi:sulfatase maturation enzyme AslB (radical SAM superfamily)
MGGEPLMNPDVAQWLRGIRELFPTTQIRFVTNGLLLHKHWDIVELLHELGNSVLKISYHLSDDNLNETIRRIMGHWVWEPVTEFHINRWRTTNEFRFQINRPEKFFRTFRGTYDTMLPHDNTPADAFKLCVQKRCPLLFNGQLFKCGTAGLTPDILERFDRPNWEAWQPYVQPGLSPDCSEEELLAFANNFGRPHAICRQCPSEKDLDSIINHKITVIRK